MDRVGRASRSADWPLSSEIQTRAFESADRDHVVALWRKCGLVVPWNDPDRDIAGFLGCDDATILVACTGEAIVASAAVGYDGHRGWIYYVAVHPDHRRRGIGRRIMEAAEDWFKGRDVAKVQLMIRPDNHDVARFYARLGYQAAPRAVMQRWLAPPPVTEFDGSGDGKLAVTETRLEMRGSSSRMRFAKPAGKILLLHAPTPSASFFRYLYENVGEAWLWWERRAMDDKALEEILLDPLVEFYVLYVDGVPAGFGELDFNQLATSQTASLNLLGLMPSYLGKGYGRYLLTWVIDAAWQQSPERLVTTICSLDHPHAAAVLQQHGFVPVEQNQRNMEDPRRSGLIPAHVTLGTTGFGRPTATLVGGDSVVTPLPRRD